MDITQMDVEWFMKDLAKASDPAMWLADVGVTGDCGDVAGDVAELLQSMALCCTTGHGLNMPGSDRFYQVMKRMTGDKMAWESRAV